jgi:hypothetical protein
MALMKYHLRKNKKGFVCCANKLNTGNSKAISIIFFISQIRLRIYISILVYTVFNMAIKYTCIKLITRIFIKINRMTTKLTLSINEETVKRAKLISRKKGKSISKMVEEYLNSLSEKEEQKESVMDKIDKIMTPYRNKIQLPENKSYKEMIKEWRSEDYANEQEEAYKSKNKKGKNECRFS